jgi:TolB-like protein
MKRILFLIISFCSITLAQEKPHIAILQLDGSGLSTEDLQGLTNRLQTEFFKTEKFTVLERSKIDEVLEEQQFQMIGCTDLACAVEIGRLLNVEYVVIGNVDKVSSIYSVNLRLVDVVTGEIVKNEFEDCPQCSLDEVFLRALKNATHKIAGLEVKPPPVAQQNIETSSSQQTPARSETAPLTVKRKSPAAGFSMGYFGGFEISGSIRQEGDLFAVHHQKGFSVGMSYDILLYKKIFLKAEMVVTNRKAKLIRFADAFQYENSIYHLHIPLMVSFHLTRFSSLFFGPSFGFFMGGSWESPMASGDEEKDDYNSPLSRFILGTEYRLGPIYIGFRQTFDLSAEDNRVKNLKRNIEYFTVGFVFTR